MARKKQLELKAKADAALKLSVRKAKRFVWMQERLIPVLEARQKEKFDLLKDNVRRHI